MISNPTGTQESDGDGVYCPSLERIEEMKVALRAAKFAEMLDADRGKYNHTCEGKTAGIREYDFTRQRGMTLFRMR